MKKIFVFIGKPMTGKSTLAAMLDKYDDVKIVDDYCNSALDRRIVTDLIHMPNWSSTWAVLVIVCHPASSDILLNNLKTLDTKEFQISVVRFEQL